MRPNALTASLPLLAALAVAALLAGALLLRLGEPEAAAPTEALTPPAGNTLRVVPLSDERGSPATTADADGGRTARSGSEEPPATAGEPLEGVVVDLVGAPVAGVALALGLDPGVVVATSDASGAFAFARDRRAGATVVQIAQGEPWATVVPAQVASHREAAAERDPDPAGEAAREAAPDTAGGAAGKAALRVVAARAGTVAGFVENERGEPLAGARIEVRGELSGEFFGELLDGALGEQLRVPPTPLRTVRATRSEANGAFALHPLPEHFALTLSVTAAGHRSHVEPVRLGGAAALRVRLQARPPDARLSGSVHFPGGEPAPLARLEFGPHRGKADREGRFELPYEDVPADAPLVATYPGRAAAVLAAERLGELDPKQQVELVLGDEALSIAGRVLDADGEPLAGWSVALLDGTPDGRGGFVEDRVAGRTGATRTDAEGRFELGGLDQRAYRLWAAGAQGPSVRSEPLAAGRADVLLRVER